VAVRLSDIAQRLGLNTSTVSRALRDDPRVQEPTRRRVQAEAAALGYRPNWTARALAEGRSRTLWFLLPELDSPVEREPAAFAGRWLLDQGYDLLLALHHHDPAIYARILDRLVQGGADGALILPGNPTEPSAADRRLVAEGFPVVYFDRPVPGLGAPVVTSDNAALAASLVHRLADRAAARGQPLKFVIDGFDSGRNAVEAARSRGVRAAAQERALDVVLPDAVPRAATGAWVSTGQSGPEAWLARGGTGGVGIFDGWNGQAPAGVPLVVARQDFRSMAEQAAALVLQLVVDPTAAVPGEVLVPGGILT